MYTSYNKKVKSKTVNIFVGEYYATGKNEVITTLLGSCVGVCLIDSVNKVYGMNHFLLPGNEASAMNDDNGARFGINSMELLIDEMLKNGAEKKNLQAKVFGGAKIIQTMYNAITVSDDNIKFARKFLKSEGIPILAEDVGGTLGRRIYLDARDGSVYVEKVRNRKCEEFSEEIVSETNQYRRDIELLS